MNLQAFEKIITPLSLLDDKSHREFLVKSLIGNFKEYKESTDADNIKLPVPSQVIFYNPDQFPKKSEDDESFSDDVMIIDENGIHGIGYYDFELLKWSFHTDTLVDYDEPGHETKWKWYYPIFEIKDVFPEKLLKKS